MDRSEAETLDCRGAAAPFLPPDTLKKNRVWSARCNNHN
jgi:hypothetical protein